MRRGGAKFVPRQLTTDHMEFSHDCRWRSVWQKYAGLNVSHKDRHWWWVMGVRLRPADEDAVSRVAHSVVSPTKKITPRQIQGKMMLLAFFDHEFVPPAQTVNGHFYVQGLQRWRDAVRWKRRDKWQGEWFLHHDSAPRHIACCAAIPHREKHSCHHPTTVLSGSRSKWLLAVPYAENWPQGDAFRNHGGHHIECDGWTPEDSKRSLPAVLPTMAGSMEQMCVCARILIWRWLGKRCHMSYHYSAIPQFRELFDCPSNIHAYIHTHTNTHKHTYIHTYVHTYIHTYIYTHTRVHKPTHMHTYALRCLRICGHAGSQSGHLKPSNLIPWSYIESRSEKKGSVKFTKWQRWNTIPDD